MHLTRSLLIRILLPILLLTLACNLPTPTPVPLPIQAPPPTFPPTEPPVFNDTPPPTEPPPPTETTIPAETTEGIAPGEVTPTLIVETLPPPTEPPPSPYLPSGFLADTHDGIGLTFFDLQGRPLAELNTPGEYFEGSPFNVHVAGGMADSATLPPLVYHTYENGGALMLNNNEQINTLIAVPDFLSLKGAPGQPILAYSTIEYVTDGVRNRLYVGTIEALPTALPVLDVVDPEAWAMKPLAVVVEQGQPVGIWHTSMAYGIGGDIVFEPRRSLSYLNLSTGDDLAYYGQDVNPSNLSPDLSWVAYTVGFGGTPITLDNLYDSQGPLTIPLLPDSDRGAGDAVFSPDNQYIAWKEGSGWMMAEVPDFHATIRIATTSGTVTAQVPDETLSGTLGSQVEWIKPVGWLDNETLVLEIRLDSWDNVSLYRLRFDGSGIAYLAPGSFVGFLFP